MNVRPAGREACSCASPYNTILERLDAMEAQILVAMQQANTAVGIANAALRQVQAAGIRTINQIEPDADGEFSISAGSGIQINAGTNGIEIENTSQGAIYTGVSPIVVNEDNEISLKDWEIVQPTDYVNLRDNTAKFTQDTVIQIYGRWQNIPSVTLFCPKGSYGSSTGSAIQWEVGDTSYSISLNVLFRATTPENTGCTATYTTITESSGIVTINNSATTTYKVYKSNSAVYGAGNYIWVVMWVRK